MFEDIFALFARTGIRSALSFKQGSSFNPALSNCNKNKKYLLYVHIPFCEKLCPYCSFNRYEFEPALARDYFSALRSELEIYRQFGYDCDAVYVGGGTPTILPDELFKTLELIKRLYSVKEISLETNPNHLSPENIKIFKQIGVHRLSVGVQSFNDEILKATKRYEVYGGAQEIKERLRAALCDSYVLNVDMMFNFPHQTQEMLECDIESIREISPQQVTFYPLMPSGAVLDKFSASFGKVNYKKEKQFYFKILDGLRPYFKPLSVWCFGKKKAMIDEYIASRSEYIGVGSGSFGLLASNIYANSFSPRQYIDRLKRSGLPVAFSKRFSEKELTLYGFLMQLFSGSLNMQDFSLLRKELFLLKVIGVVEIKDGFTRLTRKGMYYWVIAMREFFIGVSNVRQYCRSLTVD